MNDIWLGNYFGFTGRSYDGNVYDSDGLCPCLRASMEHGSVPKVVEYEDRDNKPIKEC